MTVAVGLGPGHGASRVRMVGASTEPSATIDIMKAVKDLWDADNVIRPIPMRARRCDPLLAEVLAMVGEAGTEVDAEPTWVTGNY